MFASTRRNNSVPLLLSPRDKLPMAEDADSIVASSESDFYCSREGLASLEDLDAYYQYSCPRCGSSSIATIAHDYEKIYFEGVRRGDNNKSKRKLRVGIASLLSLLSAVTLLFLLSAFFFFSRSASDRDSARLARQGYTLLPDQKWYLFSPDERSAPDAIDRCSKDGGRLLEIGGHAHYAMLGSHLTSLKNNVWWVAASDRKKEGTFTWLKSGETVNESFWGEGQPDNWPDQEGEPGEHCAQLFKEEGHWRLNDRRCDAPSRYICQII